jgi:hypothetical protein
VKGLSKVTAAATLLAAIALGGCANHTEHPVPKPQAYHRIQLPDSAFRAISLLNVTLLLNSEAQVHTSTHTEGEWIDVSYPQFPGAHMYLTLTSTTPHALPALIANREERVKLDIGNSTTELTELTSEGEWKCRLFLNRHSVTTPVHVLAINPARTRLLSGSLHIGTSANHHVTPDSIAPIVETCARDLLTTLKQISEQ